MVLSFLFLTIYPAMLNLMAFGGFAQHLNMQCLDSGSGPE